MGKICHSCGRLLNPPFPGKERFCEECSAKPTKHRLYMKFERCHGWRVTFCDLGNNRVAFREFIFADSGKIEELVSRTETKMILEDRSALEVGLRNGLGAVNLTVSDEHYRKLLR